MLDVKRIQETLRYARLWEMDLTVFGSMAHQYYLAPPLPVGALERWETEHGLTLPEDYRTYITQVGNGLAGPGYGILPFDLQTFDPAWKNPCIYGPERQEEYNAVATEVQELMDEEVCTPEQDARYEADYEKLVGRLLRDGVLTIGTSGCCGVCGVALNGGNCGAFLHLTDELEYYDPGPNSQYVRPFAQVVEEWRAKIEAACDALTQAQLNRSARERRWMAEFAARWSEGAFEEAQRLVHELEKAPSISNKCLGFLDYLGKQSKDRANPSHWRKSGENWKELGRRMDAIVAARRGSFLPALSYPGYTRWYLCKHLTLEQFLDSLEEKTEVPAENS